MFLSVVLSYSCHPVIFAECWAILYVLVIKLTKEMRRRVWRGRDCDGGIGKGQIADCTRGPKPTSLSYIHLGSSVCHPVCHPVIFLSYSCHSCGTLSYSLCLRNQTGHRDEREGFEREGYRWRDRRGRDWRGRVWIDFSLYKPNLINKNVHSATCSCSVKLYKQWFTLADFFSQTGIFAWFSLHIINFAVV